MGLVCAAHIRARLTERDVVIIEVNARLAGGLIPRLVELTGTDLVSEVIAAATDAEPIRPLSTYGAAAIRFILPPVRAGVLAGVDGLDKVLRQAGVTEAVMYPRPGQPIALYGDFRDRIGHIIAAAPSPVAASSTADAVLACVRVVLTTSAMEVGYE